jgi:hypothetical protein
LTPHLPIIAPALKLDRPPLPRSERGEEGADNRTRAQVVVD